MWDDREAEHVRAAILSAPLRDDPSPYVYVENVFSPAAYTSILDLFPADPGAFRRWHNPADPALRAGNYEQRREIELPHDAHRLPPAERAFWSEMAAFLSAPAFLSTLVERFPEYAGERFGAQLDDPSFGDLLGCTVSLHEHDPEYYLGPHTDHREKVFSALFYFPERDGLDHLGTSLYRPLQRDYTSDGSAHHDPAGFDIRETLPYRPNSALVFARTDVMFHGVERLTADALQGSRRRGIHMQFWLRSARPRSAFRIAVEADVPATMRAGADAQVSYRLTNRAASELTSAYPTWTQMGYRWIGANGEVDASNDSVRTPFPAALAPGESRGGEMRVVAPRAPGRYLLRISVVQEGVAWFDDIDPDNGVAENVTVWNTDGRIGANDIVSDTDGIALGPRWHQLEREHDAPFRWVDNDAVVHAAALRPLEHALCALVEPGPGLGVESLQLAARLQDGAEIGRVSVATKEIVRFPLPASSPAVYTVELHAEGGGTRFPGDPRVLNFRVFALWLERVPDIFPPWAKPVRGFYPLEQPAGSAFRWVSGDAVVALGRDRGSTLAFEVEPGPGLESKPFVLHVDGPDGTQVMRAGIDGRTTVHVPLDVLGDAVHLTLRAEGGGCVVAGDPRTLNYRIFAVGG